MTRYWKNAVGLGDPKQAALYFDHVIPINLVGGALESAVRAAHDQNRHDQESVVEELKQEIIGSDIVGSLVPARYKRDLEFRDRLANLNLEMLNILLGGVVSVSDSQSQFVRMPAEQLAERRGRAVRQFFTQYDFEGYAIDVSDRQKSGSQVGEIESVFLVRVPKIIDVDRVSWRQIIEFRNDKEAIKKLRRFRLFAFESYSGCEKDQIEDDIAKRLDEYEEISKSWGFETANGAISSVLTSKWLAGSAVGSFLSAASGQPALALAALGSGALIELGKIAVYVDSKSTEKRKLLDGSPVSYVSYARQQLSAKG